MMKELAPLYSQHLNILLEQYRELLNFERLDGIVLHSGQLKSIFFDDQHYPFKVTPYFRQWLPELELENCWLVISADKKPLLIYYQAKDYWHNLSSQSPAYLIEFFEIVILNRSEQVASLLPNDLNNFVYIGPNTEVAQILGFEKINIECVINSLNFNRIWKTEFEIACLERANEIAVKGHLASRVAFYQGASEFDLYIEYLSAIGQSEFSLPYASIIASNEHGATLHYGDYSTKKYSSQDRRSLLIDAGASFRGYGADVSRTYSYRKDHFAELIQKMDFLQLNLIESIKVGQRFTELQELAYAKVTQLLVDEEILHCSYEEARDSGLTSYFFPHGIGHHIGLQTHDVGGFLQDDRGTLLSPPDAHPYLRCTRVIEPDQIFTVEPGLYFIPLLLKELADSKFGKMVNWQLVDTMVPYGGIRIEDNVLIKRNEKVNLTRKQNWQ